MLAVTAEKQAALAVGGANYLRERYSATAMALGAYPGLNVLDRRANAAVTVYFEEHIPLFDGLADVSRAPWDALFHTNFCA